ncbi:RYamide receptor-like [Tubulanus polymorphus]|uniref:RYamide receptor-like n=1 Tax=Tubulanus polymorphus TaxID=672921 RepID=UPI003DA6790F
MTSLTQYNQGEPPTANLTLGSVPRGDPSAENETIIDQSEMALPIYAKCIIGIMYTAIIIMGVGGNVIVCYIVLAYKRMRTVTNYFIVNLALSDILMAVICIPFTIIANMLVNYWPFGAIMCPIVTFAQVVAVFLSSFTLVAISLDRYIAIMIPLRPKMTTRQAIIVIVTIWILSSAVSSPVAILSTLDERKVNIGGGQVVMRKYCIEDWSNSKDSFDYSIVIMCLQYFLPLLVLIFTYTRIGFVIWVKKIPGEAVNQRDQRMAASKRKMVKMMITVVMIYAMCWLPLHTVTLIGELSAGSYNSLGMRVTWIICQMLAMGNSCCNPFVYCWMNATYRNGFRYALRFCPFVRYDKKEDDQISRTNTYVTTVRSGVYTDGGYQAKRHSARKQLPPPSNVNKLSADNTSVSSSGQENLPTEYVPLQRLKNGGAVDPNDIYRDDDECSDPGYD